MTRPEADALPVAKALEARGMAAIVAPLMTIVDRTPPGFDGGDAAGFLLTSVNGARALARTAVRRDLPVFAVGDGTAAMARESGFLHVASAGGAVEDLAALVASSLPPSFGPLLHVAGTHLAGDLAALLRERGFTVRRERFYEARAVEALPATAAEALRDGAVDGVLLFSPRTAGLFVTLVGRAGLGGVLKPLAALCLSAAVARRLDDRAWGRIAMAPRPDLAGMLSLVDPPAIRP